MQALCKGSIRGTSKQQGLVTWPVIDYNRLQSIRRFRSKGPSGTLASPTEHLVDLLGGWRFGYVRDSDLFEEAWRIEGQTDDALAVGLYVGVHDPVSSVRPVLFAHQRMKLLLS